MGLERLSISCEGNSKDAPDTARHHDVQIASKREDGLCNRWRHGGGTLAVTLPGRGRHAILRLESRPRKAGFPWFALLCEEVSAEAVEQHAERGLVLAGRHRQRGLFKAASE